MSHSSQPSRLNIISTISLLSSSSAPGGRSTSISILADASLSNSDGFKPTSGSQVQGGLVSDSESALTSSDSDGLECKAHNRSCSFCCATLCFFVGGFEFSVEAACKMVVCINVMGKCQVWCYAGSLVDLSLFFSDLMASSFSRPLLVVPCMQWHAAIPVTIKAIALAKGRSSPLQGGTHASRVALCGLGPHAFFLVETCFCTVYNFNICYFSLLNTQVRVLLSESAHTYVLCSLSSLSLSCGNFANPLSCGFCYLCQIISAQLETRIEDSSSKQVDLWSFWVTCPKFRFGQSSRLDFLQSMFI